MTAEILTSAAEADSDEELVERLRKQAKQAHAMDIYLAQGEVGPGEQSKQMTKAADAITRLLREKSELANTAHLRFKEIVDLGVKVASARAQGAEEMREAAAECVDAKIAYHRSQRTLSEAASRRYDRHDYAAKFLEITANSIRALPLPSPVAVQAAESGTPLLIQASGAPTLTLHDPRAAAGVVAALVRHVLEGPA